MADYKGKIVAITGAASGLGKAMATRFAEKGVRLSLADLDGTNLSLFEKELKSQRVEVITTVVDVRDYDAVKGFADKTFETYGMVDFCINNAGINSMGRVWKLPLQEWRNVFEINVMGIVHGINAFIPRMIEQDKECFLITTASNAGLQVNPSVAAYAMSKHAAVSVTESLALELQLINSKVKTFVFCPGLIPTGLNDNSVKIKDSTDTYFDSEEYKRLWAYGERILAKGLPIDIAMDRFFAGLEADDFYIRTHDNEEEDVEYRVKMVLEKKRPRPKNRRSRG